MLYNLLILGQALIPNQVKQLCYLLNTFTKSYSCHQPCQQLVIIFRRSPEDKTSRRRGDRRRHSDQRNEEGFKTISSQIKPMEQLQGAIKRWV